MSVPDAAQTLIAADAPGSAGPPASVATDGSGPARPALSRVPLPRRRKTVPVLLLAFVVLVGGGVAAAGWYFGWFAGSGGSRPSDVFPANTAAYVEFDLNPSAAQKVQAWQFLRELPEVAQPAGAKPDPKRLLWQFIGSSLPFGSDDDFDAQVKPWLGDRAGFGLVQYEARQAWVTAVQVTDADAALTHLRAWIAAKGQAYDVTARGGYALITMTPDTSRVLADLDKGSLSASQDFTADIGTVGDLGFLSGWVDLHRVESLPTMNRQDIPAARTAFALRFSADTAALEGRVFGLTAGNAAPPEAGLGELPSSTGAAIAVTGGSAAVERLLPGFGRWIETAVAQDRLTVKELTALLGTSFAYAAPSSAIRNWADAPVVGVRSVSEEPEVAVSAAEKLLDGVGTSFRTSRADNLVAASNSAGFEADLFSGTSLLSGSGTFRKAVPHADGAALAGYLDVPAYLVLRGDPDERHEAFADTLRAVGAELVADGTNQATWSVRLVRT